MTRAMIITLFLAVFSNTAQAALAICKGKVEYIMNRPGGVYVKLDTMGGSIRLCDSDQTNFSVSPETCKDYKSTVYLAFSTGKSLMIYINNADVASTNEPYNCPTSMVPNNLNADIPYMQLKR